MARSRKKARTVEAAPRKQKTEPPSRTFDLPDLGDEAVQWQRRFKLRRLFWGLVILAVPALFIAWQDGFPNAEIAEVRVKAVFAVATLMLVLVREFSPAERRGKAGTALSIAALLAVGIYFNLGGFHGHTHVHHWEQFHYALGAKYFPELGHDGLYAASIEAQINTFPNMPVQPVIRDLRTNEVVPTQAPESVDHRREVRERFSAERWRDFNKDHRFFLERNNLGYLSQIRRDHGFNPPPSWTFVARLFAWSDIETSIGALALLDVILLVMMFVVVFRTYGARLGCLSLILFGVNYAGRYYWVGGAFLREDWLAATVIGICLLQKERYRWAGACFGYAAAVRIFPVLFLFGPAVVALRALLRRERPKWILDLGIGFVLTLVLAFGAGTLTGRGPSAWTDFADAITLHRGTWLTNNVGLDNVLLYDGPTYRRELVNFSLPEPWIHWQAKMDQAKEDRQLVLLLAKALLLLLIAATAWRLDLSRAAMLGMAVVFTMVLTTCYYWQMLLLVPLLRNRWLLYGAFGLNLALYAVHFMTPVFELRYGFLSWGLLVLFAVYLVPRAWTAFRGEPALSSSQ